MCKGFSACIIGMNQMKVTSFIHELILSGSGNIGWKKIRHMDRQTDKHSDFVGGGGGL